MKQLDSNTVPCVIKCPTLWDHLEMPDKPREREGVNYGLETSGGGSVKEVGPGAET